MVKISTSLTLKLFLLGISSFSQCAEIKQKDISDYLTQQELEQGIEDQPMTSPTENFNSLSTISALNDLTNHNQDPE